jgi:hypothetical protein
MIRIMVEPAEAGGSPSADEALGNLAAVIYRPDMNSDTYEADVVALIGVDPERAGRRAGRASAR